jgi:hypothetical protein
VLQEVPEELKARTDTSGEASLRGHLKAEGDEQTGSQSYIPPDPQDDKALHTALDLIRGIQKNSAYPPNPKTGSPELDWTGSAEPSRRCGSGISAAEQVAAAPIGGVTRHDAIVKATRLGHQRIDVLGQQKA